MKKYNSYKDSGIEWIHEIPEHWEMWKISHSFKRIGSGTTPESGNPLYHENGTINWLNTGDLNDGTLNSCAKKITGKALEDYSTLKTFPSGSLVMAMYGATIGKTSIINFNTTTNQACCVFCEGEIIDVKFLQYWFIGNKEHIINLAIGGGQPNISQNILKDVRVSCPDFNEQKSIANYLDQKTTQIDTLIAKKEHFISLLQEERTAVINQAVTKGLDPKVKMKDSGIEWLGEIPEHWEILSFRFCIDVLTDFTSNGSFASLAQNVNYLESGYSRLVRLTDLRVDLKNDGLYVDENAHNFLRNSELFGGEMLIANVGAYAGLVKIMPHLEGKYTLAPNMFLLRLNQNSDFFYHQLNAPFCAEQLKMMAVSSAQPKLNKDNIRQLKVVKPPIEEQDFLVKCIEKELLIFHEIISKAEQEIELLKEYKTAMISEVVTGKVDVRDIVLN